MSACNCNNSFTGKTSKELDKIKNPLIPNHQRNILIVEDDHILQTICKYYLNQLGYKNIDIVKTAEAALKKSIADYDLIISDFNLGSGMNGIELGDTVYLRLEKRLPIIMISINENPTIIDAKEKGKVQCFLQKPFSLAELKQALDTCLPQKDEAFQEKTFDTHNDIVPSWVEMIQDMVEGAGFSYSRIAYRIKVSPSTIQKLATNKQRKPRHKVFHPLLCLYYKVFQGPYATPQAIAYWKKKRAMLQQQEKK